MGIGRFEAIALALRTKIRYLIPMYASEGRAARLNEMNPVFLPRHVSGLKVPVGPKIAASVSLVFSNLNTR